MVAGILLGLMFFTWCVAVWASWPDEQEEGWKSGDMESQVPKAA